MKKILLGIPTYKYLSSMAFSHLMGTLLDGVNANLIKRLVIKSDMYVTMARNEMCLDALNLFNAGEITHLLMIDDDMLIPPDGISKLSQVDAPIVSAAYYTRGLFPVVYNLEPFKFLDTIPKEGIIQVEGVGCGCLLVDCKVLANMHAFYKDPWWFQNTIAIENGEEKYLGEDVFFFTRLKKMGIPTTLCCDVQCGHLGVAVADREMFDLKKALEFKKTII